jgi:hypothetical protein
MTTKAQFNQTYVIKFTLTDSLGLSSPISQTILNFTKPAAVNTSASVNYTVVIVEKPIVKANITANMSSVVPKTPVVSIKSISDSGEVLIVFSEALVNSSAADI